MLSTSTFLAHNPRALPANPTAFKRNPNARLADWACYFRRNASMRSAYYATFVSPVIEGIRSQGSVAPRIFASLVYALFVALR